MGGGREKGGEENNLIILVRNAYKKKVLKNLVKKRPLERSFAWSLILNHKKQPQNECFPGSCLRQSNSSLYSPRGTVCTNPSKPTCKQSVSIHGADIIAKYNSRCTRQPEEELPLDLCENAAKSSKGVQWEEEKSSPTRCKLLEVTVAGRSPPGDSPLQLQVSLPCGFLKTLGRSKVAGAVMREVRPTTLCPRQPEDQQNIY